MRVSPMWLVALALLGACTAGPTSEEIQSQIDQSITSALASTTSSTTPETSTTTTSPATTTSTLATTTTEPMLEFPRARQNLEHGGDTWSVILAVSTGPGDPALRTAVLEAEEVGYQTGPTGCDWGVAEALGLPTERQYYSVSIYFNSERDAELARDAFHARKVGATVAQLQTLCLD